MSVLGQQFFFPFSHATRVDLAFGHLGSASTEVEVAVFTARGEVAHRRRFLDVFPRGCVTTRHDAKSDNLARFVGPNLPGLVELRGGPESLLTASSLVIGKGLTACSLLRPVQASAGSQFFLPIAIGRAFHLLLASPFAAETLVKVEVAPSGEDFVPLQEPLRLGQYQVAVTEDAFVVAKPAVVRATSAGGEPILAWGLGLGADRSELYPLCP
ncbi:MAG: hypothetical protein RBU30_02655 [Polyangia bacterium]|nr:hypothetical protein [Polyangia bacterium]